MSPAGSHWQVVSVSQDVGWIFGVGLECRSAFLHPSSGVVCFNGTVPGGALVCHKYTSCSLQIFECSVPLEGSMVL